MRAIMGFFKSLAKVVAQVEETTEIIANKAILSCKKAADDFNKSYVETKSKLEEQKKNPKVIKSAVDVIEAFNRGMAKANNEVIYSEPNSNLKGTALVKSNKNSKNKILSKVNENDQYNAILQISESEREQVLQERDNLLIKYEGYLSVDETDNMLKENYSIKYELEQIRPELEKLKTKSESYYKKRQDIISQRIRLCYPNIKVEQEAYKDIVGLTEMQLNSVERNLGLMHHNISCVKFRGTVSGTRVRELDYDHDGRIYASIEGNMVTVFRVGNKGTQYEDIKWIRSHCR